MPEAERERFLEAVGHPPPEIGKVLETAQRELAATRYTQAAKDAMRQEKTQAARQQFESLTAKHVEQSLRDLRQAEGVVGLLSATKPRASTVRDSRRTGTLFVRNGHDAE
jgi:phosphoglycolate phosphatase-like HAD superfamily hydrolase